MQTNNPTSPSPAPQILKSLKRYCQSYGENWLFEIATHGAVIIVTCQSPKHAQDFDALLSEEVFSRSTYRQYLGHAETLVNGRVVYIRPAILGTLG